MKWLNCLDFVIVFDGVISWLEKFKVFCGGVEGWERKIVFFKNGMRVEFKFNEDGLVLGFMVIYIVILVDEGN